MLQSPDWRSGVTGSMAKAIDLFFTNRATLGRPTGTRRSAAVAPVLP